MMTSRYICVARGERERESVALSHQPVSPPMSRRLHIPFALHSWGLLACSRSSTDHERSVPRPDAAGRYTSRCINCLRFPCRRSPEDLIGARFLSSHAGRPASIKAFISTPTKTNKNKNGSDRAAAEVHMQRCALTCHFKPKHMYGQFSKVQSRRIAPASGGF